MSVIDPDAVSALLVECAETFILPRYRMLEEREIATKTGPRDLVTQADIDVEHYLEKVLPGFLPGSVVIGEEGISRGESSLQALQDESRPVWVVDPVDGTHNFVHQKREFGIMLACVVGGRTQFAWIYDVLGQAMLTAERGSGAFIGGKRLRVEPGAGPDGMAGHINPGYFPKAYKPHIAEAQGRFRACGSLNCAAHEYLRIASGQAQFSLYSRLKPWDHLPGVLIVEEAGGIARQWDRSPYTPRDHHVGLIVAASEENWQTVYDIFLKNFV